MNKRLLIGSILVFCLLACASTTTVLTPTAGTQSATGDAQPVVDKTQEYLALQTIIALEQATNTPTPEVLINTPKLWTEITTITAVRTSTAKAIASSINPETAIMLGPGSNYRIACYVDEGFQLLITGKTTDSSWLRVAFGQGQTCYVLNGNSYRINIVPNSSNDLWISSSAWTISVDTAAIATVIPTATLRPLPSATPTSEPAQPVRPRSTFTTTPTAAPPNP